MSNLDFLSLTVKNVGPNLDQAATLLRGVMMVDPNINSTHKLLLQSSTAYYGNHQYTHG